MAKDTPKKPEVDERDEWLDRKLHAFALRHNLISQENYDAVYPPAPKEAAHGDSD